MTTTPRKEAATGDLAQTFSQYVPSLEGRDIVAIRPRYGLVIGGEEREPRDGGELATIEPATGDHLAVVAEAGASDVDDAVAAARRAYEEGWRDLPGRARAKYLFRLARLIQDRSRELAVLESIDGGKPIRESRDIDLPLVAAHFFYHAGWADKLEYAVPGMAARPLGVVGQIIPWNFPLLMAAWKIAPALACGNTVVLKPAETTPLTALLLAELIQEADLPPGVVNVVTGAGATGAALAAHPGVDKVAFTGSTEVGKAIRRALAGTGTRLTLELGGKGAHLVFDDAALDQAVEGIVDGIFFNQGHVCCAGSRLLVQEDVADDLLERLRRRVELLRVGDPLDKNTDVGAINSSAQLERIRGLRGRRRRGGLPHRPAGPRPARARLLLPAHDRQRRRRLGGDRPRGGLRPGADRADLPHRGRGRRQGERHPLRPVGRRLDREGLADPLGLPAPAGRGRLGQHLQPLRPGQPVRRRPRVGVRARGRPAGPDGVPLAGAGRRMSDRLAVRKTYKLFIGGAFPRSESGRTMAVTAPDGRVLAHVARASRKDVRDAVRAARGAQRSWAERTAYNRGQILYRVAEVLEGRAGQLAAELEAVGVDPDAARADVEAAVDAAVYWAGFADKLDQLAGGVNPVAGPFLNLSETVPLGVCALACPDDGGVRGVLGLVCPAIMAGNAVVALAGGPAALVTSTLGEVVATSDVPGGVVNLLTGDGAQLLPWMADHEDVDLIDLSGAPQALAADLEARAAENLKRTPRTGGTESLATAMAFCEIRTVWHPARI